MTSKKALPQAAHFHIEQEKLTGLQSFMVPSLTNCNPGNMLGLKQLGESVVVEDSSREEARQQF